MVDAMHGLGLNATAGTFGEVLTASVVAQSASTGAPRRFGTVVRGSETLAV
jgi:hypothetical protein